MRLPIQHNVEVHQLYDIETGEAVDAFTTTRLIFDTYNPEEIPAARQLMDEVQQSCVPNGTQLDMPVSASPDLVTWTMQRDSFHWMLAYSGEAVDDIRKVEQPLAAAEVYDSSRGDVVRWLLPYGGRMKGLPAVASHILLRDYLQGRRVTDKSVVKAVTTQEADYMEWFFRPLGFSPQAMPKRTRWTPWRPASEEGVTHWQAPTRRVIDETARRARVLLGNIPEFDREKDRLSELQLAVRAPETEST